MSAPLTSAALPETTASEQSRRELQARLAGLGGLGGRKLDPEAKAKKLREACEGFESIFIQKMWQEMRNTVPKSGLLSGREEKFWQDMYDQELSKSMTHAGGIGLADMMYQQLSRNLASASSVAANATNGAAFTPAAAPLVTQTAEAEPNHAGVNPVTAPARPMAAIYDGEAPSSTVPLGEEESRPVVPSAAHKQNLRHADTFTRQPGSAESTLAAANGLNQAYLARRDAGDKLSANAVRPSLRTQKKRSAPQHQALEPQQNIQTNQPLAHGSAQSLSAALEAARAGSGIQPVTDPISLREMVTNTKARNSLQAALNSRNQLETPVGASEARNSEMAENQPVIRKTTYTTNIPATSKNKRKNDGIRMLNVDNVSVNSKQGKGLAEWHARQAAMSQNESVATPRTHPGAQNLEAPQPTTPISPLTAQDAETSHDGGNFMIPPLKPAAMNLQG